MTDTMKALYRYITSMQFMAFLFMVLAFAMATATFVESSRGTAAARALIYNTHWFELLWGLLALNLINNIFKYRLFSAKRFTLGLFHLSFLAMMAGALLTRYFGFEGIMHIREGESSEDMISSDDYFSAELEGEVIEKSVMFSEMRHRRFITSFDIDGQTIEIEPVGFIAGAERKAIPSANGDPVIDFVYSSPENSGMQSLYLFEGNSEEISGLKIGFETETDHDILFFVDNGQLYLTSSDTLTESSMSQQGGKIYNPGDTLELQKMFLYSIDNFRFLVRDFIPSATFSAVKSATGSYEDAVIVQVKEGDRLQTIPVFGRSGVIPDTVEVPVASKVLKLAYGSRYLQLPFSLYLEKFIVERYPGSDSPSSFRSEVVLTDNMDNIRRDVSIFMNNTLRYKKYKFFQSSYDKDEKGTVLSVSSDFWGTRITYLGYALLTLGIILSLLNRNSYFRKLARRLKKYSVKGALVILLCGIILPVEMNARTPGNMPVIDHEIVKSFSELWVQGTDGRIEPVSTLAGEIVRKVSKKSSFSGKSPEEIILSMTVYPELWYSTPFIRVSNKTLAGQLGISEKHISLQQLFDEKGNYIIAEDVRSAYSKNPALRNRVDKELIYLDERVSICYMVFRGSILRLFPGEEKDKIWYSPGMEAEDYKGGDSIFIKSGFSMLVSSITGQDKEEAVKVLETIEGFQNKYGDSSLLSDSKKRAEILYNRVNPFERIFPYYMMIGFMLLFVLFVNIFRLKPLPGIIKRVFLIVIWIIFLVHTAGLILRWYIAGHAPWSNGYESMVYVAWAAMLAGLLLGNKYPMVVGTASFLSGIALFVAHLSWMNPEITNLVPVLKSYWLTIHVSVITSSYGFIGLSAFLGVLVLILVIIRRPSNENKVNVIIGQLTTINEMSAIAGLYFLTIGTLFGAIWANESWGRYWGWDPKETWSLITILIYSFIVHMRLIPKLGGIINYNIASVLGFGSVLMTYFGVNYYLSGLHSYGQGSADKVSPLVPLLFAILAGLMIWAYYRDSEYEMNRKKSEGQVNQKTT
jgi:cytochrome c-type biogenesis protein CcsB